MKHVLSISQEQLSLIQSELPEFTNYLPLQQHNTDEQDLLETISFPDMLLLENCRRFTFAMMAAVNGERLGCVHLLKIVGKTSETFDIDQTYYNHFVLSIFDNKDSLCFDNEEYFALTPGEVVQLDGTKTIVTNDGETDLVVLVVEIKKPVMLNLCEETVVKLPENPARVLDFKPKWTKQLQHFLNEHNELWQQSIRTKYLGENQSSHWDTQDIVLRFAQIDETASIEENMNDLNNDWYPAANEIPHVNKMIYELAKQVNADRIGRCVLTKLPKGKKIKPHVDQGASVDYYQRFHICIQNRKGAHWLFGEDKQSFEPKRSDCYIINNKIVHEVVNDSTTDRITLIVDLHTRDFEWFKETT